MAENKKRILLIDGDFIAYRSAAVGETRTINVKHIASGKSKEFENKTSFKNFMIEKGYDYKKELPKYEITERQSAGPFGIVAKIIKNTIGNLQQFSWADETEIHLGAPGPTFRNYILLPSNYKDNRSVQSKPLHLIEAKEFIKKTYGFYSYDYLESDDSVSIRAYEELAKNNYPIIATIDKDAYQAQGIAVLDWYKEPWEIKEISSLGTLYKDNKAKVRGDGLLFLAYQTLAGDVTDTYKPYELSKITYGSSRAFNALVNCTTEKEVLEKLISEYKRLYPELINYIAQNNYPVYNADWEFMLQIYFKCSYMKRSWSDSSNFWDYATQYGLNRKDYV